MTYFERTCDVCANSFGVSPCTAVKGTAEEVEAGTATGDEECFNTRATCHVRQDYINDVVTKLHVKNADYLRDDIEAIPDIKSIEFSPGRMSLGENIGIRASLKVTFEEHPSSDTQPGGDPNRDDRDYIPYEVGTYWGKEMARHPFVRGRASRLLTGTSDQALEELESRSFDMEEFDGPFGGNLYTITAKDALKRLSGDRALYPPVSSGYLSADISAGATSATLAPTGIGDDEYAASGYMTLGSKESVAFTRSGDVLTLTRAQFNTEAQAHEAGDKCQVGVYWQAQDPADIIKEIKVNGAGIDAALIPIDDWREETASYYGRSLTRFLAEPTACDALINGLILQCGLAIWWDQVGQQFRLQVLRAISTDAQIYDDEIIDGDVVPKRLREKRVTEVWVYYGLKNPLADVSSPSSYRSTYVDIDTDAQAEDGRSVKRIYAPWIPFGGQSIAQRLVDLQLAQYRRAPRRLPFKVFRYGSVVPSMGDGCMVSAPGEQKATGARELVPAQIVSVKPDGGYYHVEADESRFSGVEPLDPNDRPITITSDDNNFDLTALHQEIYGAPRAGSIVTLNIEASAIIGSDSTSSPALNIGDTTYWPTQAATGNTTIGSAIITGLNVDAVAELAVGEVVAGTGIAAGSRILSIDSTSQITLDKAATATATGVSLTIYLVQIVLNVHGKLRGKGGRGGEPGYGDETPGGNGYSGGSALKARYPFILGLTGDIKSGGGGGGGGAAHLDGWWTQYNGRGGGGGAGRNVGPGGTSGNSGSLDSGGSGISNGYEAYRSGNGGAPGSSGASSFGGTQAFGGAPGNAIDGLSFKIEGVVTGVIAGPQVN